VKLSLRGSIILALGFVATAFLALGSHDVAASRFGIPYPADGDVPGWARYLGQFVRLAAMVCACRLASWHFDKRSTIRAAATFGLIIVLLQETLRAIIIGIVVTDGWRDLRWIYILVTSLPDALFYFYSGAAAVVIARSIERGRPMALLAAVAFASLVGYFGLLPALELVANMVVHSFRLESAPEIYRMPYGLYVYTYIYSTFIEATLASFLLIYLVWPSLEGSKFRRVVMFSLLVLLIRGRVVGTGLFSFWIKGDLPAAFAAEGQFFAETLVLAVLTGLTWAAVTPMIEKKPRSQRRIGCSASSVFFS
jgi:hypothetical protein